MPWLSAKFIKVQQLSLKSLHLTIFNHDTLLHSSQPAGKKAKERERKSEKKKVARKEKSLNPMD